MLTLSWISENLEKVMRKVLNDLLPGTDEVLGWISSAIRSVFMFLCKPVYRLMNYVFGMFEVMGDARILENEVGFIFNRVNLILGLFMIFRLTLYGIQYIVNPDNMSDSKVGLGNIIKKVLIVIVLLGSTRFLFDEAYDINHKLIKSHIIDTLILGPGYIEDNDNSYNSSELAWYSFSAFYKPDEKIKERLKGIDKTYYQTCELQQATLEKSLKEDNDLSAVDSCLQTVTTSGYNSVHSGEKVNYFIMDFDGLLCLIAGIFLLWTLITYSIQLGVRLFQLAYLEMIAPIPIMMYLTPNGDEKLKKWGTQCLVTFLDYFVRIAIIDFIIVAIIELSNMDFTTEFKALEGTGFWDETYFSIIMFIALMQFAKKIPGLIQELLPSGGLSGGFDYGLGLKGLKKTGAFAAGAVGAGAGLAAGAVGAGAGLAAGGLLGAASGIKNGNGLRGKIGGAFGGLARGMYHGSGAKDLVGKIPQSKMRGRVAAGLAAQRSAAKASKAVLNEKGKTNSTVNTNVNTQSNPSAGTLSRSGSKSTISNKPQLTKISTSPKTTNNSTRTLNPNGTQKRQTQETIQNLSKSSGAQKNQIPGAIQKASNLTKEESQQMLEKMQNLANPSKEERQKNIEEMQDLSWASDEIKSKIEAAANLTDEEKREKLRRAANNIEGIDQDDDIIPGTLSPYDPGSSSSLSTPTYSSVPSGKYVSIIDSVNSADGSAEGTIGQSTYEATRRDDGTVLVNANSPTGNFQFIIDNDGNYIGEIGKNGTEERFN